MTQTTITRRTVLAAGAAGAAFLALPLRLVGALADTGGNSWTFAQWSSLVGSGFAVSTADGGSPQLTLLACSNLMPAGSSTDSGPQTFILTFEGSSASPLGEGIQTMNQGDVGSLQLFLSPGAAGGDTQHYEAVINRL